MGETEMTLKWLNVFIMNLFCHLYTILCTILTVKSGNFRGKIFQL